MAWLIRCPIPLGRIYLLVPIARESLARFLHISPRSIIVRYIRHYKLHYSLFIVARIPHALYILQIEDQISVQQLLYLPVIFPLPYGGDLYCGVYLVAMPREGPDIQPYRYDQFYAISHGCAPNPLGDSIDPNAATSKKSLV